jgi:hypothetical protein
MTTKEKMNSIKKNARILEEKKTALFTLIAAGVLVVVMSTGCATRPKREQKAGRSIPVSWYLYDEVVVDLPAEEAFNFLITRMADVYTDMAEGHVSYEVVEGIPLAKGKHVNCREVAGPQEVFNHYVVKDLIPDRMIYFVSDGSRILYTKPNGEVEENESNTHAYWDFVPLSSTQTKVSLTVVIGLKNPTIKFMGSLLGSKKLWRNHLTEELVNMGRLMEQNE